MPALTLIRGLPGSGKSTYAKRMANESYASCGYRLAAPMIHLEADMYFTHNGEYKYVSENIPIAHNMCRIAVQGLLALNRSVIVSNTFTRIHEMEPYVNAANMNGCDITIVEMKGSYGSIHNVPEEAIQRMRNRWEALPADWEKYMKETP